MNFKEFIDRAEGLNIHEGPRGRKVGEFLGGMGGMAASTLGGAAASDAMIGGDGMFGQSGAPGGILGTGAGYFGGKDIGASVGGEIGDRVGNATGWLRDRLFRRKKKVGAGQAYIDKLQAKTGINPDDAEVATRADGINTSRERNKTQNADAQGVVDRMLKKGEIREPLEQVLAWGGYKNDDIIRLVHSAGNNNTFFNAIMSDEKIIQALKWVKQELAGGRETGTAKLMGQRVLDMLKAKDALPPPGNAAGSGRTRAEPEIDLADPHSHDEPEVPNMVQPSVEKGLRHQDLFGGEAGSPGPGVPKMPRTRRKAAKKKAAARPSLFDAEPETGSLF